MKKAAKKVAKAMPDMASHAKAQKMHHEILKHHVKLMKAHHKMEKHLAKHAKKAK